MKMLILFVLIIIGHPIIIGAQTIQENEELNSSQLEELAESEESENEDDYNLQQLMLYKKNPLYINGDIEKLRDFPLLDALLANNIIQYRNRLGDLISVYELQAVPGFTADLVRQIIPFITVSKEKPPVGLLIDRFHKGQATFVMRPVLIPQKSEGFLNSDGSGPKFLGSRPALFVRYKYQYRQLLQYGFTGDKDAGERMITQKFPFVMDFTSFHLFLRDHGLIRNLAIGDFTVNLGQGLIHWQSQAFKKSAGVTNIKRQSEVLRPYQSAGEFNFLRGIGTTWRKKKMEVTFFASYRKLSANVETRAIDGQVITSILTSGLNRSAAEIEDRNKVTQQIVGVNVRKISSPGHVGLNLVSYRYSLPLHKREELYTLYSIRGRQWFNGSVDYSYTVRNFHLFGELATDLKKNPAFIGGVLASLNAKTDLSMVYRRISKSYQAPYGNAFTENTLPNNETGWYSGLSLKPDHRWKIDAYADVFYFPWLKYRVDAPSTGAQYFIQLDWKPSKVFEIYSRFRRRLKPLNADAETGDYPDVQGIINWRTHASFQISRSIMLRNRVEICRFEPYPGALPERGYLFFADLLYKPSTSSYSGSVRIQHFETGGYNSRLYAYENDLMLVSSTPAFFDSGIRCYINFREKIRLKSLRNSQLSLSLKFATTVFSDKNEMGSGLSTINGNRHTEMKFQVIITPDT